MKTAVILAVLGALAAPVSALPKCNRPATTAGSMSDAATGAATGAAGVPTDAATGAPTDAVTGPGAMSDSSATDAATAAMSDATGAATGADAAVTPGSSATTTGTGGALAASPPPGSTDTNAAAAASASATGGSGTHTEPWLPVDPNNLTITANPDSTDIAGTSDRTKWLLEYYNTFRAEFGSPPVAWNSTLAQGSADWTKGCEWKHQGDDNLSEALQSATAAEAKWSVSGLIDGWAGEWKEYPFNDPEGDHYSHFTEMVWKATTQFGCSWSVDCAPDMAGMNSKIYLTCKHYVAGNMMAPGYFAANVGNFTGK